MNIDEIKKVYLPNKNGEFNVCYCDYQPLLESFGYDILTQNSEDDYQGDSFILYHNKTDNQYGFLVFGWGSCSGCDALQSCKDYAEILQLYEQLKDDIKWFDNHDELIQYLNNEDRNFSYYIKSHTFTEFKENVINLFKNREEVKNCSTNKQWNELVKKIGPNLKTIAKNIVVYINDLLEPSNIELPQREDFYDEIIEKCFKEELAKQASGKDCETEFAEVEE